MNKYEGPLKFETIKVPDYKYRLGIKSIDNCWIAFEKRPNWWIRLWMFVFFGMTWSEIK